MEATFSTEIDATQSVVMHTKKAPAGFVVAKRQFDRTKLQWRDWIVNLPDSVSAKNLKTLVSAMERAEQVHIDTNPPQASPGESS